MLGANRNHFTVLQYTSTRDVHYPFWTIGLERVADFVARSTRKYNVQYSEADKTSRIVQHPNNFLFDSLSRDFCTQTSTLYL